MKLIFSAFAAVSIIAALALATNGKSLDKTTPEEAARQTRPCQPKIGASAAVRMQCTKVTDADSGVLTTDSCYMLQCDSDAWMRFGSAAVTAVADVDFKAFAGQTYYIPTGGSQNLLHMSCLNVRTNGDCRLTQCF